MNRKKDVGDEGNKEIWCLISDVDIRVFRGAHTRESLPRIGSCLSRTFFSKYGGNKDDLNLWMKNGVSNL